VATVVVDSQLATRARVRSRDQVRSDQERNRAAVDAVGRRPWRVNARERALSALIKQHCFPREYSSTPPQATDPDCRPSLP
jgi:hypothetical protein